MSQFTLYGFPLSNHSRLVEFFATAAGLKYDYKPVNVAAGEQKTAEYTSVNPLQKVPSIQHRDVAMSESGAIVRYLAHVFPTSLYPVSNLPQLAKIENAYEFIRTNLWANSSGLAFNAWILPVFYKKEKDEAKIAQLTAELHTQFAVVEANFFKQSPNHVVGSELTLADVGLAVVLGHLQSVKFDISGYAKIKAFWENIQQNDSFKKTHAAFFAALH